MTGSGNGTTGFDNISVGNGLIMRLQMVTGSRNITIGNSISVVDLNADDQLNIGNTIYGNLATDSIGIGNTNPNVVLTVNGVVALEDVGSADGVGNDSGYGKLYVNGDELFFKNDSGVESELSAEYGVYSETQLAVIRWLFFCWFMV